ncbi:MAG TPA: hypothetical protein VGF86_12190 [Candidatus Tumulicola sp.]|jgi:hypothetical protein
MKKSHNILLACALGVGSLLGAAAPASAAHVSVGTVRSAATGRVLPSNRYYGTGYRNYGYRYGNPYRYGYPYARGYGYGSPYGSGISIGVGYGAGYVGGGYGYAPYPVGYARPAYRVRRPYSRPYRRAYLGPRVVR